MYFLLRFKTNSFPPSGLLYLLISLSIYRCSSVFLYTSSTSLSILHVFCIGDILINNNRCLRFLKLMGCRNFWVANLSRVLMILQCQRMTEWSLLLVSTLVWRKVLTCGLIIVQLSLNQGIAILFYALYTYIHAILLWVTVEWDQQLGFLRFFLSCHCLGLGCVWMLETMRMKLYSFWLMIWLGKLHLSLANCCLTRFVQHFLGVLLYLFCVLTYWLRFALLFKFYFRNKVLLFNLSRSTRCSVIHSYLRLRANSLITSMDICLTMF